MSSLLSEIYSRYQPVWNTTCDPAHRKEHFSDVALTGFKINRKLKLGCDEKLIIFVAHYHDLFTWSRRNHHELAHDYVLSGNCPIVKKYLTKEEATVVAEACLTHRASYKGEFKTSFQELMNAADRGSAPSLESALKRSMDFGNSREGAIAHIKEKFGSGGYARYPKMYVDVFGDELEKFRKEVDAIKAVGV